MNEALRDILTDLFELEGSDLSPDLMAEDVELWDSLNHLRLVTALEEAFAIKLSMAEIEAIDGVPKLLAVLEAHGVR